MSISVKNEFYFSILNWIFKNTLMISLLNDKLSKISKTIELLSKLHKILTRRPLLTI